MKIYLEKEIDLMGEIIWYAGVVGGTATKCYHASKNEDAARSVYQTLLTNFKLGFPKRETIEELDDEKITQQ